MLFSALVSSLFGHGLYFRLIQRHPVATITPWLLLVPVLVTVFGVVFQGDRPGPRLLAGGAMVLAGVLGVALRGLAARRPAPVAEDA